jgi:hypothetical protein
MVSPLLKWTLRNGLCGVIGVRFWKLWSPNCSSRINKASHLEHFAPIVNFSIYSVELELHDRKV